MSTNNNFFAKLTPYIGAGIFIVLAIIGFVILSYLLIWGAIIGLVIYAIVKIKSKLFPTKKPTQWQGNVYDHDKLK